MINPGEGRIEGMLRRLLTGRQQGSGRAGCLDEETLATYLHGTLSGDEREKIEAHLADCSACLNEILVAHKAPQETAAEKIPQHLLDRAMSLVRPAQEWKNFLDVIVHLVKDSVELVSTSGRLIASPAPAGVRGRADTSRESIIQVEKGLGGFRVTVEIEQVEAGLCQVGVKVRNNAGDPVEGIRVSLIYGGRERASYLTRHGETAFDRLPPGDYNLAVSDAGQLVGTTRLRIEENQHEGQRSGP